MRPGKLVHESEKENIAQNGGIVREQALLFPELETQALVTHSTGILASQHLRDLIAKKWIESPIDILSEQIQPASLDLRLGAKAFRVEASFLPGKKSRVLTRARDLLLEEIDLTEPA